MFQGGIFNVGDRVYFKLMCAHRVECCGKSLGYCLMSPRTCERNGMVRTSMYTNVLQVPFSELRGGEELGDGDVALLFTGYL